MQEETGQLLVLPGELTIDERSKVALSFKRVVTQQRNAWRGVYNLERSESQRTNSSHLVTVQGYRKKIEEELLQFCLKVIGHCDVALKTTESPETKVFLTKMQGDYYRYLAEFQCIPENKDIYGVGWVDKAMESYQTANAIAQSYLPTTHPIRLELVLNFAVFHEDVLNLPDRACMLAKVAFDEAMADLDSLTEDQYKDSTTILQLLRDNMTKWTNEMGKPHRK